MFRKDFCLLLDVAIFIEEELNLDLEEKLKIPGECFFWATSFFFFQVYITILKTKIQSPSTIKYVL